VFWCRVTLSQCRCQFDTVSFAVTVPNCCTLCCDTVRHNRDTSCDTVISFYTSSHTAVTKTIVLMSSSGIIFPTECHLSHGIRHPVVSSCYTVNCLCRQWNTHQLLACHSDNELCQYLCLSSYVTPWWLPVCWRTLRTWFSKVLFIFDGNQLLTWKNRSELYRARHFGLSAVSVLSSGSENNLVSD